MGIWAHTAHSAGVPLEVFICLQVTLLPNISTCTEAQGSSKLGKPRGLPGKTGCRPSPGSCHASGKKGSNVGSEPLMIVGGFLGMWVCECYDRQAGRDLSQQPDTIPHPFYPLSLLYRKKQIGRPEVTPRVTQLRSTELGPVSDKVHTYQSPPRTCPVPCNNSLFPFSFL